MQSIVYLGMRFHCPKAFVNANIPRIESAERAVLALRSRCAALNLYNPIVLCQLFDALILPVIMYGVEVWGAQLGSPAMHKVESMELAFLRRLLGLRTGTPSFAVRAELGRYPLLVTAAKLVCDYRNRLVRLDGERLAKQAFLRNLELSGQPLGPWARQVHSFLVASHTACDLVHPTEVDAKDVIATLECRHLESTLGPKSQHYVDNVRAIDKQSYTTRLPICRWSPNGQTASGSPSCARDRTG